MNNVELWTILWIPVSLTIVVLVAFNADRIEALFAKRKRQSPAE
jgi:hypothetical protein